MNLHGLPEWQMNRRNLGLQMMDPADEWKSCQMLPVAAERADRLPGRLICDQTRCQMQPDEQTSDRADLQTDRRATRQADIQPPGQTFVQICLQTGRMAARCSSSSAGIRTTADMRSGKQQMHILQNRLAEQNGRTEWQDRMADRCEQMQMNAQP